ncbi:TRAP-type C4-dicarboxylate transport system, small permease component [Anaerovirgula multivorans]|uniref:TRAP-type C4-dicarboxylate transport system, small permease component n=1 Tax=Anaerovirgula multivorans TaxID=312168 RepID=A0A239LCA8_9FIRM|nr:TRAP transporter small permease [Anaerovirgula multivorans]SNT27269.1 TRAP-type C4-dicarboxylate transport system, small permease component [Anaerovirgula multivorans]
MKTLDRIVDFIVRFIMAFSALILSIVTTLQVVARYIFKSPIGWGQDIIRLSFIYLVFWGAAYCVKEKEHLNIDILLTSLKPKAKKILELGINIVLAFFFMFIIYYGFIFTQSGANQKAPYLSIPMSLYYLSLPTSGIFMIYYQLRQVMEQISNLKSNGDTGGDIK